MEYNKENLMKKFMSAYNAGDTRNAKILKGMIMKLESGNNKAP